jgi:hypothetical protein
MMVQRKQRSEEAPVSKVVGASFTPYSSHSLATWIEEYKQQKGSDSSVSSRSCEVLPKGKGWK